MAHSDSESERVPNRFAAELLMPEKVFKKRYKALENSTYYEKIAQLIEDFGVTQTAVLKRIEELNLNSKSKEA